VAKFCVYYSKLARDAGKLEASLADYNLVLETDPDNIDAQYCRGVVLEKMGR
jgi:TPR repeat